MEIQIKGRTTEHARPDLVMEIYVREGHVSIRFDDANNPPFWVEAWIPQDVLLRAVSEQSAYLRHHVDPATGAPDEHSVFEVCPMDGADEPEYDEAEY